MLRTLRRRKTIIRMLETDQLEDQITANQKRADALYHRNSTISTYAIMTNELINRTVATSLLSFIISYNDGQ